MPPAAHPFIDQQLTFIYTRDLAASSAFLRDALELDLVLDQFGLCHIYRVTPTSFLGVCVNREPPENPGLTYSFVVKDVDAAYETLKSRSVAFDGPPQHSEKFNVYSCFFRGIENYRFELQQFRDPSWPGRSRQVAEDAAPAPSLRPSQIERFLEHHPTKWIPVGGKDDAQTQ